MYGQFVREMLETTDEKETLYWLRKADLKVSVCCARTSNLNKLWETQDR